jgi:hypothetical protein
MGEWRDSDLPFCSIVPQPAKLPRAPELPRPIYKIKNGKNSKVCKVIMAKVVKIV